MLIIIIPTKWISIVNHYHQLGKITNKMPLCMTKCCVWKQFKCLETYLSNVDGLIFHSTHLNTAPVPTLLQMGGNETLSVWCWHAWFTIDMQKLLLCRYAVLACTKTREDLPIA